MKDSIEYVLEKLKTHDLVMIGERHWTHEEPMFLQEILRHCYDRSPINYLYLEFGRFVDQSKLELFLSSASYDPRPVIEILRDSYELGWGYQEYLDIFRLVYEMNQSSPPSQRVEIILTAGPPDEIDLWASLQEFLHTPIRMQEDKKNRLVGWLDDALRDRDRFMASIIEATLLQYQGLKGIFYGGYAHIRKNMHKKDYGRVHLKLGGLLDQAYPGRVFSITLHQMPRDWADPRSNDIVETLLERSGRPIGFDLSDHQVGDLRTFYSGIIESEKLRQMFDGYIILNRNRDYNRCAFVPGFYDDEFAKIVWERLRKHGYLERLPHEFEEYVHRMPTGEELMALIEKGLT